MRCNLSGQIGWLKGLVLALALSLAAAAGGGCGPSKKRPVEADVSGIPAPVLASFRRDQPNSIIRGGRATDDGFRIDYWTPLRKKHWVLYNLDGDKLKTSN